MSDDLLALLEHAAKLAECEWTLNGKPAAVTVRLTPPVLREAIAALRERVAPPCAVVHAGTGAACELPQGHTENHRGTYAHGIAQWPRERVAPVCATCGKARHRHCDLDEPGLDHSPNCDLMHHEFRERVAPVEADGPRGIEFVDKLRPDRPKE
jgi:hypothetical protein